MSSPDPLRALDRAVTQTCFGGIVFMSFMIVFYLFRGTTKDVLWSLLSLGLCIYGWRAGRKQE